jgi:hypothetical protein
MKIEEQSNATLLIWVGALLFICGGLLRLLSLAPGYEGVWAWGNSSMIVGSALAVMASLNRHFRP